IEGRGTGTWLGSSTGPVLIIRCAGVELRDLQVEMTGALEHPAILVEGDREPTQRNVTIRRGELRVARPVSFAAAPKIRLKEQTPPVPAWVVPRQVRARTQPPPRTPPRGAPVPPSPPVPPSAPVPPSSPLPALGTPGATGQLASGRIPRVYLGIGIGLLGI